MKSGTNQHAPSIQRSHQMWQYPIQGFLICIRIWFDIFSQLYVLLCVSSLFLSSCVLCYCNLNPPLTGITVKFICFLSHFINCIPKHLQMCTTLDRDQPTGCVHNTPFSWHVMTPHSKQTILQEQRVCTCDLHLCAWWVVLPLFTQRRIAYACSGIEFAWLL